MSRAKNNSSTTNESVWLVSLFARRYLFSKKSHSLVNTISLISSLSVAVPVAALIVLLSVFGGINSLLETLNSSFDSQIKVSTTEGRFFNPDLALVKLSTIENIEFVSSYIEDNALARYNESQTLVTVRGVDTLYRKVVPIEAMIKRGEYSLGLGDLNYAVVGMGVAYNLGVNINLSTRLELYVPSEERSSFLPTPSYNSKQIFPNSVFAVDAETDGSYIIVPLKYAQELFGRQNMVSSLAIIGSDNTDALKKEIKSLLGDKYKVEDRYEQKQTLYQIMNGEKRMIFMISMLVIIIASFSLTGSLVMLMADKKPQIETLKVIGATESFIDKIFFMQGLFISFGGLIVGLIIGVGITLVQHFFGIVTIDSQTLLIDKYPVVLSLSDIVSVVFGVAIITILIIFATVKNRTKQ